MKHFQWKHLRVTFLLTALPVATLGSDPVRPCSYVFIFFLFRFIDFLNFPLRLTLICGLVALTNYNVKGLQRQRQFLVKEKPWVQESKNPPQYTVECTSL